MIIETVLFGVIALLIVTVGWLAWPVSDVLDLAPPPSRMKLPGVLMCIIGIVLLGWSMADVDPASDTPIILALAPKAVQFIGGALTFLGGVILIAAAAIVDAINARR